MSDLFNPPQPTNDGGIPAQDLTAQAPLYSAEKELNDKYNWAVGKIEDLGALLKAGWDKSHIMESLIAFLFRVWGDALVILLKKELSVDKDIVAGETSVMQQTMPLWESAQADIGALFLTVLGEALGTAPGPEISFGSTAMAKVAESLFSNLVQKFTLVGSGIDLTKPGSGLQAQQYLLSGALNLALQQWVIDSASQHVGLGFLKDLQPFLWVIDRSINPSNVVRQAVESSYALLLRAPLTRDLNRAYPIKDLGLTALAKLYVRGAVDHATYLDRCLDSGLNADQADQLILESAKLLSVSEVGTLLQHGLMTQQDATQTLKQQGYPAATADGLLSIQQNSRLWSIQERVGNEAVTAWKNRYIDQPTLESILKQTGFSDPEISLLELEAQFVKGNPHLSLTQVKDLYTANLITFDEVLTRLEDPAGLNYTPDDARLIALLDFTDAAQRQARNAQLIARLRVTAEAQQVTAAADLAKQEDALAKARQTLADELNAEATTLGELAATPGILALIGSLP